jgi:hypothetical protein
VHSTAQEPSPETTHDRSASLTASAGPGQELGRREDPATASAAGARPPRTPPRWRR